MKEARRRASRWGLVAAVILLATGPAWAQGAGQDRPGDVVERDGTITRNWTQRLFRVRGSGAPPDSGNLAQRRILAKESARANAQLQMMEAILGTTLDAQTYVKNAVVQNQEIQKTIERQILKRAVVLEERERDDGGADVTLGLWVTGELADALLGPAPERRPVAALPPGPAPAPGAAPPSPGAAVPDKPQVIYTGLVIDARGLNVRPAMAPRILSEAGQEIFGRAVVDKTWAVQQGMAGYLKDLAAAQASERVGERPLTVKGLRADGANRSDVVISNVDAGVLLGAAQHLSFLEKARVVIVVD